MVRSPRAAATNGISCPARPSTSLPWLLILTTPSSRSVRESTQFRRRCLPLQLCHGGTSCCCGGCTGSWWDGGAGSALDGALGCRRFCLSVIWRFGRAGSSQCLGCTKRCRWTGGPLRGATRIIPSRTVSPARIVPCLAAGEGAEGSIKIVTVVEGTSAAMEIVVIVSAAAGANWAGDGRAAREVVAEAGEVVEAGEVLWVLGVAGVETTGEASVLVGAMGEVEAVGARGAGETFIAGGEVGARKSNIVKASTAAILAAIQPLSLPYSNVHSSSRLRPHLVITFLQSRLGSACSNISILSFLTIMPRSVTTPLMWLYVRR